MKKNVVVMSDFVNADSSVESVQKFEENALIFLTNTVKKINVLVFFHINISNVDYCSYVKRFPVTILYLKEEEHPIFKKQNPLSLKKIKEIRNQTELKKEIEEYTAEVSNQCCI